MKNRRAFSLIELMIAVLILGILAAIAIPHFSDAATTARATNIVTDTRLILNAAQLYMAEEGEYPPDGWWGDIPEGLEEYLPDGFEFSRHSNWDVLYSFDNLRYPVDYSSYARRTGIWISISVWTKDQEILNSVMDVAPGYMVANQGMYGRSRLSVMIEPYIDQ